MKGGTATIVLSILLLSVVTTGTYTGKVPSEEEGRKERGRFVLGKFKSLIKSEEGDVKVVSGYRWRGDPNPMCIGFVEMEPHTMFIPQYIDANLIIFVRSGHAKIGWILKDEMAKRRLRPGDIIVIPAGSTFYLINHCTDQRLQIIASIDSTENSGFFSSSYHSFFVGGGNRPASILAGFDAETITAAFNLTMEDMDVMMTQSGGPIIRMNPQEQNIGVNNIYKNGEDDGEDEADEAPVSMWRRVVDFWLGRHHHHHHHHHKHGKVGAHQAYNVYDRMPDFRNEYGWSIAVGENEYAPLKHAGIGVYLVHLTEGSMMAPHINPTATEYGIVLDGVGSLQVVFPNGTAAINTHLSTDDVFRVPRYFPFCQLASRGGPLRFFGFTMSAKKNRPQFLAGKRSVLRTMRGEALAGAFNVSVDVMNRMLKAQHEEVILPMRPVQATDGEEEVVMMNRRFMSE